MPRKSKKTTHAGTPDFSAVNLSSTGTLTGNAATIDNDHANPSTTPAHILVKALETFMFPIIAGTLALGEMNTVFDTSMKGIEAALETNPEITNFTDTGGLSPEAKGVLIALETYITSLVRRQKTEHGVTETEIDVREEKLTQASKQAVDVKLSLGSVPKNPDSDAYEEQLLKVALDQAQYRVFNRMPIRLLTFRSDGSGMDLIERSAIWDRISASIRSTIDDLWASVNRVLRSMFKWYCDASICITYLAQTTAIGHMHTDPWFTRGWTLQELIAPRYTKFYGKNWHKLAKDSRHDATNVLIQREIQTATTIMQDELNLFQESRHRLRISRRMQWAANRRVTREEDTAYSLMGIFDVSISIAYGEGAERAFFRLVNEIIVSGKTDVLDIVNWCNGPEPELEISPTSIHPSSLIPSSPKQYLWRAKEDIAWFPLLSPINLTHVGLRLPVLLMPAITANPDSPDAEFHPIGLYSATINIDAEDPVDPTKRLPRTYNLLDRKIQTIRNDWKTPSSTVMLFGVLNFGETDTAIILPSPSPCLALCLHSHATHYPSQLVETSNIRKVETSKVIVFALKTYGNIFRSEIEKDSLGRHEMRLHTLHL